MVQANNTEEGSLFVTDILITCGVTHKEE
jgi:hypothetical protein